MSLPSWSSRDSKNEALLYCHGAVPWQSWKGIQELILSGCRAVSAPLQSVTSAVVSVFWEQWVFLTHICFASQQCSLFHEKDLCPWSCGCSPAVHTNCMSKCLQFWSLHVINLWGLRNNSFFTNRCCSCTKWEFNPVKGNLFLNELLVEWLAAS